MLVADHTHQCIRFHKARDAEGAPVCEPIDGLGQPFHGNVSEVTERILLRPFELEVCPSTIRLREHNRCNKSGSVGGVGENKSREGLGGIGVGEVLEGLAHDFAQEGVGVNLADGFGKVGGWAVLVNAEGAAAGDEGLRVEALVIIGGGGERDEDDGDRGAGKFEAGGGAGTGDDEVGPCIGGTHVLDEGNDFDLFGCLGVDFAQGFNVCRTALMGDGYVFVAKGKGGEDGADQEIEAVCALTAARDKDVKTLAFGVTFGFGAGQSIENALPQRQTGQLDLGPREAFGRVGKRGRDGGDAEMLRKEACGAAGEGIRFVQDHGDAEQTRGDNGREAGVTAGGEKHVGAETFEEGATAEDGREVARVGDGARAGAEQGALPRFGGVALRGAGPGKDKGKFMALGTKAVGDGECGIDVATGAAAGDGDAFGVWHGQRSIQSMSCRARAWAFTLSRRSRTHFQRQEMEPFSSMGRSRNSPSKPSRRSR